MTYDFAILGAGIAGLTAARGLLKQGFRVCLIEKSEKVGGLARTIEVDGFRFDIGGHRFHSNNPAVINWLEALLGDDLLAVPRTSHIYLQGKYVEYPIRLPQALTAFPPSHALRMGVDYLWAQLAYRRRADRSFEDWVTKRFGRAMFAAFFRPYTEKVWGIKCDQLSAEWAIQRIGLPSLWQAVRQALRPAAETPATAIRQFRYPRLGFGMIPDALEADILQLGGSIYTATTPQTIISGDPHHTLMLQSGAEQQTIRAQHIVSTIPLPALIQSLADKSLPKARLRYRDLICVFLGIRKTQISADSWTYFPDKRQLFGRTHEPKNWSAQMVPDPACSSLGVEIFCNRDDAVWQQPAQQTIDHVVSQLAALDWIDAAQLQTSHLVRVPNAYPIYDLGYARQLQTLKDALSDIPRLHLLGRTGSFRYMNSDGVVESVFAWLNTITQQPNSVVIPLANEARRWV